MLKKELAAALLSLRADYEQVLADNVRLRAQLAVAPVAVVADEVDVCAKRRLVYDLATAKRISIKYRTAVRFNGESHRYEVKLDGAWLDAADAE